MDAYDVAHFLAGMMLVASFVLLYQDRIFAVLNTFAAQAMLLALAVAWQGYVRQPARSVHHRRDGVRPQGHRHPAGAEPHGGPAGHPSRRG